MVNEMVKGVFFTSSINFKEKNIMKKVKRLEIENTSMKMEISKRKRATPMIG